MTHTLFFQVQLPWPCSRLPRKPLALSSPSEFLSVCQTGCCPVHASLDKANEIFNIYAVAFFFLNRSDLVSRWMMSELPSVCRTPRWSPVRLGEWLKDAGKYSRAFLKSYSRGKVTSWRTDCSRGDGTGWLEKGFSVRAISTCRGQEVKENAAS